MDVFASVKEVTLWAFAELMEVLTDRGISKALPHRRLGSRKNKAQGFRENKVTKTHERKYYECPVE